MENTERTCRENGEFSYKKSQGLIYGLFLSVLRPSWSACVCDVQFCVIIIISWRAGNKCALVYVSQDSKT